MKKSRLILTSLLGLFFLIPFIDLSTAVPPNYIGVQVGEEYTWTIRVNYAGYAQYITDLGETVPPELTMFETMPEIQTKGIITEVSDEIPGFSYNYALINMSAHMNVPGVGWMQMGYLNVLVLPDTSLNYFNDTLTAMMTEMLPFGSVMPFIIVPYNLNWTLAVDGLNAALEPFLGSATGITIEEYGRGFRVSVPAQNIGGYDMQKMDFMAQWNSKGVFAQGEMLYEGVSVMSANIPQDEIPGFDITILLGMLGAATLGVIYYIKKKK